MRHTPGKWRAEITRASYIVVAGDRVIALIEGDDEQHEANAHLASAAPDLLEALDDLIFQCNRLKGEDASALDFDQARAAIKRAEGREGE